MTISVRQGFASADRDLVVELYWQAFGDKLGLVLRPQACALAFIGAVVRADHSFCAYDARGQLLGVAGFKSPDGAFVGGDLGALARVYGWGGAIWRAGLLTLLGRDMENRRFLLDGLVVRPEARSQGVGSALLQAITEEAARRGYSEVRLDVIDTNQRARALYEREGFRPLKTQRLGLLSWIFGFSAATTMVRAVGGTPGDDGNKPVLALHKRPGHPPDQQERPGGA